MGVTGWRSRGYLPHCDAAGLIQHVVFGLSDAGEDFDALVGASHMKAAPIADVVEDALLNFDLERYRLLSWCVMPNHVHALIEQREGYPLARVVHSWKSYTANQINKALQRRGSVWAREYFDRFMRSEEQLSATIEYIENNPVAAGLVAHASDWRWSSAARRRTILP